MKRRINLFSKKKQEEPIPTLSTTLRSYGILFLCICVVLSLVAGGVYFYQLQTLNKLNADLDNLKSLTQQNNKVQGNIVFFVNKKEQLKSFLKDDTEFEKYYTLLLEVLAKSNTDATLQSINLNLGKDTAFVITFKDFANAEKLMNFIESPAFLDNFEILNLASFSISENTANTSYQLNFTGKFVQTLKKPQS